MATGKPAHLGCKFLSDVSVVNSPIVVGLLVITALFCVVLPDAEMDCCLVSSLALLVVAIDTDIDIFRGESFLSASFDIPNGHIRLIQLPVGVLVPVSQFRLLGVDE
jgi:hypothetical protein